jgi:RNA polymerase sigma factor (TIGR02999 family)
VPEAFGEWRAPTTGIDLLGGVGFFQPAKDRHLISGKSRGSILMEIVMVPDPGDITVLLERWRKGDRSVLSTLTSLTYHDLHAIAVGYLHRESPDHTLQATGLVNELYIRLVSHNRLQLTNRRHFYAFAALVMRRILCDYARETNALKRPGGQSLRVPLHPEMAWVNATGEEMLALDRALDELEATHERAVRVIELRYFLGCTTEETAELLGLAKATADRDLQFAKTWLFRKLSPLPANR